MTDAEAGTALPRVLLAEDDPVSASFLTEALQGLGLAVNCCEDGNRALELARQQTFALLLLDCRLPGSGALDIVTALRADDKAASRLAPVIASSADLCPGLERELRAAGCQAVLTKPLRLEELEQTLKTYLTDQALALIDDQAGLQASGSTRNLQALRGLFLDELEALAHELPRLAGEPYALRERLHRLRASCGFCGAAALAEASRQLGRQSDVSGPERAHALGAFRGSLAATIEALRKDRTRYGG